MEWNGKVQEGSLEGIGRCQEERIKVPVMCTERPHDQLTKEGGQPPMEMEEGRNNGWKN